MVEGLTERARAGDEEAFGHLVDLYRRELQVHCYRVLGSMQDAEDALQETLLAAWRGIGGFEGRASVRTWLYRIATNRCLNMLRSGSRRPQTSWPPAGVVPPQPNRVTEVVWLEPYPDMLLEEMRDAAPGPEARYEARESISLAFVTALQQLPPRQRAVLVLRDVLGFHAAEVAEMLSSSEESVTSALKRARARVDDRLAADGEREPAPLPNSPEEIEIVERLTRAYEAGDLDGLVALLTEDVLVAMPPVPLEYQGRELATAFLATVAFREGRTFRLIATRANGHPAFGVYMRDPHAGVAHAVGLVAVTLEGSRISALIRFDNSVLSRFGLPRTVAD